MKYTWSEKVEETEGRSSGLGLPGSWPTDSLCLYLCDSLHITQLKDAMWGPHAQCFTWAGKGSNRTKGEYPRVCNAVFTRERPRLHETM